MNTDHRVSLIWINIRNVLTGTCLELGLFCRLSKIMYPASLPSKCWLSYSVRHTLSSAEETVMFSCLGSLFLSCD